MKRIIKYILYSLFVIFLLIQLYPKPAKNMSALLSLQDISLAHQVPPDVQQVLKTSCYDCHSNNTVYPWYASIQPTAYWLGDHIIEGKKELNFSEFGGYRIGRKYKKLEEINKQVKEGEMPLTSYTFIHRYAKLTDAQKLSLSDWVSQLRDSIKANYPADSLTRKKPSTAPSS